MSNLIARLIGIMLLRLGPQDLPAGHGTLILAVVAYALLAAFSVAVAGIARDPVAPVLLSVVLGLVLSWVVLATRGRSARWPQTAAALFGTAAVLRILHLPLLLLGTRPDPLLALIVLALFIWSLTIDAHIYRHALEVSLSIALVIAVGLFAVSYFVSSTLLRPV